MSNLTYNPNINIPYHNGYSNNIGNSNMDMEFEESNGNYNMQPSLQQMDPRGNYNSGMEQMNYQMGQQQRQPIRQDFNNYPKYNTKRKTARMNSYPQQYENSQTVDKFEDTPKKSSKINWIIIVKKLIIYTALFLIMSHVKMEELLCNCIPFLKDNQILSMTLKGVMLAIIIIFIQIFLG
jgi:hypothetical protein